jgi:ribosome-interacting GTPase 1
LGFVSKINRLEAEIARLSKWQVVEDADGKAKEMLAATKAELKAQLDEKFLVGH